MISSLLLSALFSISCISSNSSFLLEENVFEYVENMSSSDMKTYQIGTNKYVSFFYYSEVERDEPDRQSGNYGNSYIQNKYFVVGSSSTNTGTTLTVGHSSIMGMNGEYLEYKTVFGLDLSSFPSHSLITEAGLLVTKSSGLLNTVYCYVAENISYANINGITSYTSTYACVSTVTNNKLSFDLTDEVIDTLEGNGTSLNIVLEGQEANKLIYLKSTTSNAQPVLFVGYNYYGDASSYVYCNAGTSVNCLGYARYSYDSVDINSDLSSAFGNNVVTYAKLANEGFQVIQNYFSQSARVISSYNSNIYSYERRLVFRVKLDSTCRFYAGDFHFMCQCSDGGWAEKCGSSSSQYSSLEDYPEYNFNWYGGTMLSATLYFAY